MNVWFPKFGLHHGEKGRDGFYHRQCKHSGISALLPHSIYAVRHSTPAAALMSETCFHTGHNRIQDLSALVLCEVRYAASTLCVGFSLHLLRCLCIQDQ